MSKLYFVSYRVIEQAERMKDKYYFLGDEIEYKAIFDKNLSTNEANKYFDKAQEYRTKGNIIQMSLMSIIGKNQATWENIQILKNASIERDLLDMEINCK